MNSPRGAYEISPFVPSPLKERGPDFERRPEEGGGDSEPRGAGSTPHGGFFVLRQWPTFLPKPSGAEWLSLQPFAWLAVTLSYSLMSTSGH